MTTSIAINARSGDTMMLASEKCVPKRCCVRNREYSKAERLFIGHEKDREDVFSRIHPLVRKDMIGWFVADRRKKYAKLNERGYLARAIQDYAVGVSQVVNLVPVPTYQICEDDLEAVSADIERLREDSDILLSVLRDLVVLNEQRNVSSDDEQEGRLVDSE